MLHVRPLQVWETCGAPVLANTSLNVRGQPIINTIRSALELLEQQLDVLVVESWAFIPDGNSFVGA